MIEELLLWLWLFLRVSGFVQQSRQLGPCKTVRFVAFASLNIATTHPVSQVRLRRALAYKDDVKWLNLYLKETLVTQKSVVA
jgi:hypothetical protein